MLTVVALVVAGVGVLVATQEPQQKLVDDYSSIFEWNRLEVGIGRVRPSQWVRELVDWEVSP